MNLILPIIFLGRWLWVLPTLPPHPRKHLIFALFLGKDPCAAEPITPNTPHDLSIKHPIHQRTDADKLIQ